MLKLKSCRQSAGMSQKQAAEKLNISAPSLSLYEAGSRQPDLKTLTAMAELYDVSINVLLGIEKKPQPSPEQRLDHTLVTVLQTLTPEEVQRVSDFVAGLKATRKV